MKEKRVIHVIGTGPYADEVFHQSETPMEGFLTIEFIFIGKDSDMGAEPKWVMVGIANPNVKRAVVERYYKDMDGSSYIKSIAHQTSISPGVKLGKCTNIGVFSSIGRNVIIRDFVSICANVTIGHNCLIGRYSTICPGTVISGYVAIGERVFIGAGAVIKDGIKIGPGAVIGCGAVVINDVPSGYMMVGNPAKAIISEIDM